MNSRIRKQKMKNDLDPVRQIKRIKKIEKKFERELKQEKTKPKDSPKFVHYKNHHFAKDDVEMALSPTQSFFPNGLNAGHWLKILIHPGSTFKYFFIIKC